MTAARARGDQGSGGSRFRPCLGGRIGKHGANRRAVARGSAQTGNPMRLTPLGRHLRGDRARRAMLTQRNTASPGDAAIAQQLTPGYRDWARAPRGAWTRRAD
jgi:hypothetical protein